MVAPRLVAIPERFQSIVLKAAPDALASICSEIRSGLDSGQKPDQLASRFVAGGWDTEFVHWIVNETAASPSPSPIRLGSPWVSYPRTSDVVKSISRGELMAVANAYNLLTVASVLWGIGFLLSIVLPVFLSGETAIKVALFVCWELQILAIALLVAATRRATPALGTRNAWLLYLECALGVIPFVAILPLVSLGARLGSCLGRAGVRVGFWGPNNVALEAALGQLDII